VLLPVKNEPANLRACLESYRFGGELVVVDSFSTDELKPIAAEHGARVVDFNWNGQFPKKKNWARRNADVILASSALMLALPFIALAAITDFAPRLSLRLSC
jgi:glycosyltransferase involved in cell wall biosynthesis